VRSRQLILFGGISFAIYALHFLLPFPLHRYYNFQRVSQGWITDRDPVAAIGMSVGIVTLFLLYYFAYRLCLGQNARRLWAVVLFSALLFSFVNVLVFPLNSTDVYDYVAHGRITGIHEGNPYTDVPNDYPDDPYVQLAAWRKSSTVYGPLWEVLSGVIGRFAGESLWANVLAYKGLALVGYLLSTIMVASILRRVSPSMALSGTILFSWNPLVLLEGVANLHNDMLMIAFLLGGIWALSLVRRSSTTAGDTKNDRHNSLFGILCMILLVMSILVKFIPVLFLPLILIYLLSSVKGRRRKFVVGLLLVLPMILISFHYFRIFWQWPQITNAFIHRIEMFRMSISSVTKEILQAFIVTGVANRLAAWPLLAAFAVGYAIVLVRTFLALSPPQASRLVKLTESRPRLVKRIRGFVLGSEHQAGGRPWDILMASCLTVIVLYLLFGTSWFWPWYLIWPIAILALFANEQMVAILTIVACSGQLTHVLWNFVWYWLGTTWKNLYIVDILTVALMLVPALIAYNALRRKKFRPLQEQGCA
jgi:hypothetical protein